MRPLTGSALDDVSLALGLAGGGEQFTRLDDGLVGQTLVVNELARRGRTLAGTSGYFMCVLQTVHGAGGSLTASIAPYAPGDVAVSPYPKVVPRDFDVWLIGATVALDAGSPTSTTAILGLDNVVQGWGVDDSGAQVLSNARIFLALWTTQQTIGTGTILKRGGDGRAWLPIGLRIPRQSSPSGDVELAFFINTNAAATWTCELVLGLFPVGLGQDAAI